MLCSTTFTHLSWNSEASSNLELNQPGVQPSNSDWVKAQTITLIILVPVQSPHLPIVRVAAQPACCCSVALHSLSQTDHMSLYIIMASCLLFIINASPMRAFECEPYASICAIVKRRFLFPMRAN